MWTSLENLFLSPIRKTNRIKGVQNHERFWIRPSTQSLMAKYDIDGIWRSFHMWDGETLYYVIKLVS